MPFWSQIQEIPFSKLQHAQNFHVSFPYHSYHQKDKNKPFGANCANKTSVGVLGDAITSKKLIPLNVLFNLKSGICLSWEVESFSGF